jgi:hypothetical protein
LTQAGCLPGAEPVDAPAETILAHGTDLIHGDLGSPPRARALDAAAPARMEPGGERTGQIANGTPQRPLCLSRFI